MNNIKERILVVHGPNLNLLGEREPEVYGKTTLTELNMYIEEHGRSLGLQLEFFQSNHEGYIIDFLHENRKSAQGLVINPGALTHYSYALRDAVAGIDMPAVEVHLSDIHKREPFRRISVVEEVCIKQISGRGPKGYLDALDVLIAHLRGSYQV